LFLTSIDCQKIGGGVCTVVDVGGRRWEVVDGGGRQWVVVDASGGGV